jgi:tRNA G18 (ribose-2'-O)-methylase SpoU
METPLRKLRPEELQRPDAETFRAQARLPLRLVVEHVRSALNVGSFFRTADAFALQGIDLIGYTPGPDQREVARTALGAEQTVSSRAFATTTEAIATLRSEGYTLLAAEQTTHSIPLPALQLDPHAAYALVVGNELTGVSDELLAACTYAVEIPQQGTKHSLNVAVAAGILLYAISQQLRAR